MKLTWRRQWLRPRHRFATSQGAIDRKETIVVALEHDGLTGLGEAAPSRLYGQTLESTEAALTQVAATLASATPTAVAAPQSWTFPSDAPASPFDLEALLARLLEDHYEQRAAVAAVDSALHDWIGKRLNIPTWRHLGLGRPHNRTTFTLGIAEPREIREKLREALADGFDALKVKIGVDHDHETLAIVREHFHGPLLLDANEGWTPATAPAKIRALERFRPLMIEQPLPQQDWPALGALRHNGVAPIFADESCQRPADVVRLLNLVDGVNVKFTKCGGIREALRMITLARGFGMQVMLGCFVSSSLAIAPALALASLADYSDLDGALLLADDPFQGITRSGGVLELGDEPGLGVWANPHYADSSSNSRDPAFEIE